MKIYLLLFLLLPGFLFAQITVRFEPVFNGKPLNTDSSYISSNNDTVQFSTFKIYLSKFSLSFGDGTYFDEANSFHLLDLEKKETMKIVLASTKNPLFLDFNIGIDSVTNVSGALGGDLDPALGMYWAWQSGYINFKIEGKSSSCKTRKNEFSFHAGGYKKPFNSMRRVYLNISNPSNEIVVKIDLSKFLESTKLATFNTVSIPGKDAMLAADYTTKMFSVK